jgi:Secretion system C-terminal sorting domain
LPQAGRGSGGKQYGKGINLAPNPAHDFANITVNIAKQTKQAYIVLTDITGKAIQRIALQTDKINYELEISNYAKGYYHVCLYEDGAQTDCKKLIIN